jgi:protein-disulfide isomerase
MQNNDQKPIIGAIIIVGVLIAGAILLKGSNPPIAKGPAESSPIFNQCLDSLKYAQAVTNSTNDGKNAGVNSTPQGFILKNDKVVDTIDGAISTEAIKQKIDNALAGNAGVGMANIKLDPTSNSDFILGSSKAPVTVIEYSDFQCPFCGKFFRETEQTLIDSYIKEGKIRFAHRDFAFLGDESTAAAEAARCAGDQDKFWEYHDYLYNHQNGENQGNFSNINLKSFAASLGLK